MSRLTRRELLCMSAVVAADAVLASCAKSSPTTAPPTAKPAATAAPQATSEPVPTAAKAEDLRFLTYMTNDRDFAWQEKIGEEWATKSSGAELLWENIGWENLFEKHLAYETAGSQIDFGAGWSGFSYDFHSMDLTEPMAKYIPDWNDRWLEFLVKGGSDVIDGDYVMAIPLSLELYGMWVRKDLIEKAGYKVSDLTTFDKTIEIVNAVAEINNGVAWGLPYGNSRAAAGQGGGIWQANGLGSLADFRESKKEGYLGILRLYKECSKTLPEAAFTWDAGGFRRGFAESVTAFIPIGQYYAGDIFNMAPDLLDPEKVAFIGYPSGSVGPGKRSLTFGASGLYLMKNTSPERKATAVEFARWLVDDTDLLMGYTGWPCMKNPKWDIWAGMEGGYKEWVVDMVEAERKSAAFVEGKLFPARSEVHEAFYLNILPLIQGKAEPQPTYEALKAAIVPLIEAVEPEYFKE